MDIDMGAFTPLGPFLPWYTSFTPVIPNFYLDAVSSEQVVKEICCRLTKLIDYATSTEINVEVLQTELSKLQKDFEKFKESGFNDYYEKQIATWVENNLAYLWRTFASHVFFGLTDDGYFCAYVPDSWSDIQFDTGAVWGTPSYGHLILRYDVQAGSGVIDNTSPYYAMEM